MNEANYFEILELFVASVALMLLFGVLSSDFSRRKHRSAATRLLAALLICDIIYPIVDTVIGLDTTPEVAEMTTALIVEYTAYYLMLVLYGYYLVEHIRMYRTISRVSAHIFLGLSVVGYFCWCVALFEGDLIRVAGQFTEAGVFYKIGLFFSIIVWFVNQFVIFRYAHDLPYTHVFALMTYFLLPAFGFLIQMWYGIPTLVLGITLSLILVNAVVQTEHDRRINEELDNERVNIMLSQIQPHFLYNVLNTIHYLCGKDPVTAQKAVSDFSDFLRQNMDSLTLKNPIPFEQEMKHVQLYLNLQKLRFEDDLRVVYDIGPTDFNLPVLTLQPIVENAVKYGVRMKEGAGTVRISTRKTTGGYLICVKDDGPGITNEEDWHGTDRERSHIGLENVRRRLEAMCGGKLLIESEPGEGTLCTIFIPRRDY